MAKSTQDGGDRRRRARTVSKFTAHRPDNTRRMYCGVLVKFLDFAFDVPETRRIGESVKSPADLEFYDALALEYLNDGRDERDFADDMRDFLRANRDLAPKTLGGYKSVVNSWLIENHVYLHPATTRRIKAGGRARTRDRIPTVEEVQRILNHADLQLKAFILVLSSSGIRPGEGVRLEWRDIDLERGMVHIRPEISKTKEPRETFISLEAMQALRDWERYHEGYAERAAVYTAVEGFERDHDLVFLTTYGALLEKFNRALTKAGLDERDRSTGRSLIHPHTTRKYFRTRLPQGGCSIDAVECLMGHAGYLAEAYIRLSLEEIEEQYRAAEHALWVYKTKPINEQELKQLEQENRELRDELSKIQQQIATMNEATSIANKGLETILQNPDKLAKLQELLENI